MVAVMFLSELKSCVNREVGLGSSAVPNKPYGFCGREAPWKKKERRSCFHILKTSIFNKEDWKSNEKRLCSIPLFRFLLMGPVKIMRFDSL